MQINFDEERPIYIQISEGIEDAILSGAFPEESQIPSITEFSVTYRINPATALKGINILVDEGILYKKRGVGMFVAQGAAEKLISKRKEKFFGNYIINLVDEAKRLEISKDEIKNMIERGFEDEHRN
ncbi:MAG: GntR family transcriptional regulator [Clostridiaceae bacterium]|jgi:DNA-binding transcriptional regulator YhcF (GntR family)|nr:GntR family transcriptional regulator [Clostridiaceae bacterium]